MAVEVNIVNKLNNNFLQIDVKNQKNAEAMHYAVPQQYANKFKSDITDYHKKMNIISNTTTGASAFIGYLGANYFTKNIKSNFAKYGTNALAALALICISGFCVADYANTKHEEILKNTKSKKINLYT